MKYEVREEIFELIELVLSRSDVKKSMKDKEVVGNNDELEKELDNIESESVKKILIDEINKNKRERVKLLTKKYGKILLKEGLYNRIMGIKSTKKEDGDV